MWRAWPSRAAQERITRAGFATKSSGRTKATTSTCFHSCRPTLRGCHPRRSVVTSPVFPDRRAILSLSRYSGGMNPEFLRGHLEGLLLAVLVDHPGHGYALSQRLATRSGGELAVPEGSLYPALQRLERRGLVTSAWATVDGRRRRVYRL